MEKNISIKNSDAYSLWEKVGEVANDPDDLGDSLSSIGIPMRLVSLPYEEDAKLKIDNNFKKEIPKLKKIIEGLDTCADGNKNAKVAIRQIKIELKKVNIMY